VIVPTIEPALLAPPLRKGKVETHKAVHQQGSGYENVQWVESSRFLVAKQYPPYLCAEGGGVIFDSYFISDDAIIIKNEVGRRRQVIPVLE
jgi:hypothetical protein